jgi:hypothetical protein
MRRSVVLIAILALIGSPNGADAWGFEAHKFIMQRAILLLPAEIRPFFEKFQGAIVEHAIDPDLWRTAGWLEEPPRHFVDMDAYGPYPFKDLPRDYVDAVRRYGKDFVEKNGTLPWRTEEIYKKLSEALTQKAPYARDNIKFFSSVIAHYAGDAHVPFHAALNYDGQLTGQWGIHARFETELFLRYQDRLRVTPGPIVTVANARDLIFDSLVASYPLVQPVLDADKEAVRGREIYDDEYFDRFFTKVKPILERRLADSITDTASLIASAWIEAGRPALPLEAPRVPRKVRRS